MSVSVYSASINQPPRLNYATAIPIKITTQLSASAATRSKIQPKLIERPKTWLALLIETPRISPLIIRHMLDPSSLGQLAQVSRRFRYIVLSEWRNIKNPACSTFVATCIIKTIKEHFAQVELGKSQEEFERTIVAPMNPKTRKIFFLGMICDQLVRPIAETFPLEESVAMIKIIQSGIGKSLAKKMIDFERFNKHGPQVARNVINVIKNNALSLVGSFFFGPSASQPDVISSAKIRDVRKPDLLTALPIPILASFVNKGYLDPRSITRLARVSRNYRILVNKQWKFITNPKCINKVVECTLELTLQNLGLEDILKKETMRILDDQKGMTYLFTGTLGFFISQIHKNHWSNLIKAICKEILPHLAEVIPFTMGEIITLARFAQTPIGRSAIHKMIPFGFKVDQVAFRVIVIEGNHTHLLLT